MRALNINFGVHVSDPLSVAHYAFLAILYCGPGVKCSMKNAFVSVPNTCQLPFNMFTPEFPFSYHRPHRPTLLTQVQAAAKFQCCLILISRLCR